LLPQYDYDWPKNIYIIDGSGILWKPQWTNVLGTYELRIYYVIKITTDLILSSGTDNGTLKLVRNGVTTDIAVTGLGSAAYSDSTNYVPTTRKVNNKELSSDITLSLDDVNDGSARKLSDYVAKNTAITGATKIKITYDAKGLVTAGADASLEDLSNVTTTNPQTADLLRYNGTNWANAPASGTYAGPTETFLGSSTSSGYLSVADIDNFDEIIIELTTRYTIPLGLEFTGDVYSTRMTLPKAKLANYSQQKNTNYVGGALTTCNMYSNDIISVQVRRANAAGTSLNITFRGTLSGGVGEVTWQAGVSIYGRNW
jgi:hypothetical protein